LCSQMYYISHETSTPACASIEMEALRSVFEEDFNLISISNTKCITGHCLGVGLEEPIAVESLLQKRFPYTVCKNIDSSLGNILLTKGEDHNRSYVLRFSAGFGAYTAVAMYRLSL
jgi:3-oxoacyl-(acyl-carrier-protein) synthase